MNRKSLSLGNCSFELLSDSDKYLGIGEIRIGDTRVRSGRLPIHVQTQSFTGVALSKLLLEGVKTDATSIRVRCKAYFTPLDVKLMRDHSFDPIHDTQDWDVPCSGGAGTLDLVIEPARDAFGGVDFSGFSYRYEYSSTDVPLFYLLDKASWELDGDITGATVVSQSSCSAPVTTFEKDTRWSTEGLIHWDDSNSKSNPVMTHNLPRWASHQAFDFQFKGDKTLLGVFARVDLIRSIQQREPGKRELKTFDKFIFDQTLEYKTSAKAILLNTRPKSLVDQKNIWTWAIQEIHDRARGEYGLREELPLPRVSQNYWDNFTIDTYRKDLLPAALNIGAKSLFIDNMNKSAATENSPHPENKWNMCCGHEYEVAPKLGGPEMLSKFVADCKDAGIQIYAWTNNGQALSSPMNHWYKPETQPWYVRMECTRIKYGGAYTNAFSIWSFKQEGARRYWADSLKKIKAQTGLDGYLFDSFYNLGFMPVNYANLEPATQWKQILESFKELQDAGVKFLIESFGPFGQVQHGCPKSYNIDNLFACYKVGLGTGYTTIPTGNDCAPKHASEAHVLYYVLAHMTDPGIPLFIGKTRVDEVWTTAHKQALADYNANHTEMRRRILQEDDNGVIWHNTDRTRATLWNFVDRTAALPGKIIDQTAGQELPASKTYALKACHTYTITETDLPAKI